MNENRFAPEDPRIKDRARAKAVETLSLSGVYQSLSLDDQKSIYLDTVEQEIGKERQRLGLAKSMATDSGKDMGYQGYDPAFGGDTRAFKELVDSVDFPKFVADLLKAVFDANLRVMKQQTDSYIKLMKEATKSTADFLKKVKDDDAFAKLAESRSDKYNVITEKAPDGSTKLALTNPQGEKHDMEDAEVKMHLMEAKVNMAKEHRAALREVLLMGVTRLVVEKGEIEASVDFSITATRKSGAHHDDTNINTVAAHAEYDFWGVGASVDVNNTNIQVNTSDKAAEDTLSAKLHGKVNIKFKTDYFKLDNFANMYADGGVAALKQGTAGGAPPTGALPAAPR